MKLLITNGRVLDPARGYDKISDVLIRGGRINSVSENIRATVDATIDAAGFWVTPGLIDAHVHLRDPGQLHKETIATGTAAAAAGGFTTVCAMPNTEPAADNADVIKYIIDRARGAGYAHVVPCGCVTDGRRGVKLADIRAMILSGAAALSDDGSPVEDAGLLYRAMELCAELDVPMLSHCETRGLHDTPGLGEAVAAARDILIASQTGARLHICHISSALTVGLLRRAREAFGKSITGEAAPHHYVLIKDDDDGTDANFKMNPPLAGAEDRRAVIGALVDGTIGTIASDHAPHHESEKNVCYGAAANGIVGLETTVPLCVTHLVLTGELTPLQLIEKLTVGPANVLNLKKGTLAPGADADVTIIDPGERYTVDKTKFFSKGRNTPFHGRAVNGRVKYTIIGGKIIYSHEGTGVLHDKFDR